MGGFVRPSTRNYPTVYHKFEARDLNDELVQYRVQDFPLDRIEEESQNMARKFFKHEAMGMTRKVCSDFVAVRELSRLWRDQLQKGFSIACFKENSDEIVAINVLVVCTIYDPKNDLKFVSQNLSDIFGVLEYAHQQFNVYEHYSVDEYLLANGLYVDSRYRRRGIATEMLKARRPLLKALGLNVTTTAFTTIASQRAAQKAGYVENFTISYDELAKMTSNFYFPGIKTTHFKTMSLTV